MKRILFVDDEPRILEGLRRTLRPLCRQWDMVFVPGGAAALAALEAAPFDVIVSDMRMPGIDGVTLLTRVQHRYPQVVRIVLSGYTELETALRSVHAAHQFLTKPCDAATIQAVIERALGLHALLGDGVIRRTVGEMESLPSLPRVHGALTHALADLDASVGSIARIVEQDVAICAKLLQLVNSAFFGLPRRVTNVQTAVGCLGTNMLKNLVLSVEVFRAFDGAAWVTGFSQEALQRHALQAAALAKRLFPSKQRAEDAFMAAMLHDVGKLVLATRLPEEFARVLAGAREERRPVHAVEAERIGVTHAEIGAYLLGLWGLPYPIVEAVAHHHAPARVSQYQGFDVLAAVHVADALAHEHAAPGDDGAGEVPAALDLAYLEGLGVAGQLDAWRAMAADQAGTGHAA